ncbi:MAG: hypothetical protein EP343_15425 [Deltaproteobacteria bacterium]|nr:MAG: hypothetical protein EP343_15425 [Deltaproteobacteria bacterium]
MTLVRKLIGLVLAMVAISALMTTIWSTGAARVAVKPSFFATVPQNVIRELPVVVDKAFIAAKQPGAIKDANARKWVEAAAKVGMTPNDVLQKIGLYSWLKNELSTVLDQVGKVLRGGNISKDIVLNNRPLKKALTSPVFKTYIVTLLSKLQPCTSEQMSVWTRNVVEPSNLEHDKLPACNPGTTATQIVTAKLKLIADKEIKDEIVVLRSKDIPAAFVGMRLASVGLWFLFLFPLIFLALAAGIGGTSRSGKLRWFGLATLVGGIIPLSISWFVKDIGMRLMLMDPTKINLSEYSQFWTSKANQVLVDKLVVITDQTVAPIFQSVFTVAASVTIVGLLFVVLSFVASDNNNKK